MTVDLQVQTAISTIAIFTKDIQGEQPTTSLNLKKVTYCHLGVTWDQKTKTDTIDLGTLRFDTWGLALICVSLNYSRTTVAIICLLYTIPMMVFLVQ